MLKVLNLDHSIQWDDIVKSFKNYDVYYLSGYVKGFQLHGDGRPLLFFFDNGTIKGINVVMKRDISLCDFFKAQLPKNTYFDFSTPYGYGGWIIEGEGDYNPLFESYNLWCRENNVISEFVRFHPITNNYLFCENHYEVVPLSNTVSMDLDSTETIWTNITSKNRNMIRKAQKNSLTVLKGKTSELFNAFQQIYNSTMDKDNAKEYYYFDDEFYQSILTDLQDNFQIFYTVTKDNDIAACAIMLYANGKMSYHLSGSKREYQSLAPTNLLLYEAAVWGSKNGYKTFHLGGGFGSGDDSLLAFKKAFYRGDLCTFHIGKKIFNPELYNKLVDMRDGDIPDNFFPKYRA